MSKRRIFEAHGVVFTGESDDQLIGTCPFSQKEGKFYVNRRTWLWDSKTTGLSGNVASFLRRVSEGYVSHMTPELMERLAKDRQLPLAAFADWEIGWDPAHRNYTLPVRDVNNRVIDIRWYRPGHRIKSTPSATVGLLGAHHLNGALDSRIYLCEGEWDGIAMAWMLRRAKKPGIAVAVPGAGVFKPEWIPWFAGREVYSVYDHDEAGEQGEQVLMRRLFTTAQRLWYTHWPGNLPSGFDLRDWVVAHTKDGMTTALENLDKLFKPVPRTTPIAKPILGKEDDPDGTLMPAEAKAAPMTRWKTAPTLRDVMGVFTKWLHLKSTDAVNVMLSCVASQAMDGPPVWIFLVGPPGSAKTALLASLNAYQKIYSTSSLTVHALISGASWKEGVDPSLIPRLNGKVMVVKDFTSILSMREAEKEEIFGILRDAYDGRCGKVFGNGIERNYISRFTILAAVTPKIYDVSSSHTALGERFLKYAIGDNLVHESESAIISRAIGNINHEAEMNAELQDVVTAFMERTINLDRIPVIPKDIEAKIIALARFGARMRGSVSRDAYRNEIMTSRPSAEIGSRLGIQLAKLGKALAMVAGQTMVTNEEYRLLKKVMMDTIPQRNEDLLRSLLHHCRETSTSMTGVALSQATRYPKATVDRLLQDMNVLDIVVRSGTFIRFEWQPSAYIRECVRTAELYQTKEELMKPTRLWVRVIKKKAL